MRVSAYEHDDAYVPMSTNPPRFIAVLDGAVVHKCVTADEELGMVIRYKMVDGNYVKTPAMDDVERETLHGKVEIIDLDALDRATDAQVAILKDFLHIANPLLPAVRADAIIREIARRS